MKANKFIKVVPDDGDMLVLVSGGAVIPSSDNWTLGCYLTECGSWNQKHKIILGIGYTCIPESDVSEVATAY